MKLSSVAPNEFPAALIDEGQRFAVDMLERYGELLPVAFTSGPGRKPGLSSAYHDQPATGTELLGLLYGGLRTSATKGEFESVAVFSEGEMGDRDALVCFVEDANGKCALIITPFRYSSRPLRALGMQMRRGQVILDAPQLKTADRRIFVT
jgi:hypothetical protein